MTEMMRRTVLRRLAAGSLAVGVASLSVTAQAQTAYPSSPIRLVVPFTPGGGVDLIARLVGQKLGEVLGQTVVVENRAGASSTIGTDMVAKAQPDGYTLLMTSTAVTANQALFRNLPYDLKRDFAPIGLVANAPAILTVTPSVPAQDLAGLVAMARSRPGELNYASYGNGSAPHLATEQLLQATDTEMLHVPYRGGGPAVVAVLSGEVSVLVPSVIPVLAMLKNGQLRALGIAAEQRHPLLPDVPTFQEQGVPLVTGTWFGLLAPAGVPQPVIERLSQALATVMADEAVRTRLLAEGAEIWQSDSPAQFGEFLRREEQQWRTVIEQSGIEPS